MKKTSGLAWGGALLITLLLAGGALADDTWMCSINYAVGCDEDGTVGPPDLGDLARPTFFRVNLDSKEIILLAPESRRGEVTRIDTVHKGEGLWVCSGVETNRAWSLVISAEGYMTLSVTTDGATWSVFGYAMAEE